MLTEAQLLERKKGIGGSDAAACLGLSKWKTPLDVYFDKTSGNVEEIDNKYMKWGRIHEPSIRDEYMQETGKIIYVPEKCRVSEKYPFMIANIDGIGEDGGLLECKTADSHSSALWGEGADQFPDEYLMQCAHYAIVYDATYVDLAVLIGGNDFRIYKYERNKELELLIIEQEKDFWENHVLKLIPPEPKNLEDLNRMYQKTRGEMKNAAPSIKSLIENLKENNIKLKELEAEKDKLFFIVKESIGDFDGLTDEFGNTLCTWKIQNTERFDSKIFKKLHPDIYKQFTKTTASRVFRLGRY